MSESLIMDDGAVVGITYEDARIEARSITPFPPIEVEDVHAPLPAPAVSDAGYDSSANPSDPHAASAMSEPTETSDAGAAETRDGEIAGPSIEGVPEKSVVTENRTATAMGKRGKKSGGNMRAAHGKGNRKTYPGKGREKAIRVEPHGYAEDFARCQSAAKCLSGLERGSQGPRNELLQSAAIVVTHPDWQPGAFARHLASKGLPATRASLGNPVAGVLRAAYPGLDNQLASNYGIAVKYSLNRGSGPNGVASFLEQNGGVLHCVREYRKAKREARSAQIAQAASETTVTPATPTTLIEAIEQ